MPEYCLSGFALRWCTERHSCDSRPAGNRTCGTPSPDFRGVAGEHFFRPPGSIAKPRMLLHCVRQDCPSLPSGRVQHSRHMRASQCPVHRPDGNEVPGRIRRNRTATIPVSCALLSPLDRNWPCLCHLSGLRVTLLCDRWRPAISAWTANSSISVDGVTRRGADRNR